MTTPETENSPADAEPIPDHLGGAPDNAWGWVRSYLSWIFFNILFGFAIIVAGVSSWLQLDAEINLIIFISIYKSLALSILVWGTGVLLSAADFENVFKSVSWKGSLKATLTGITLVLLIITVIFIALDPPEWEIYRTQSARNDRLLFWSIVGTILCLIIAGVWYYVHKRVRDLEMKLHREGFHAEQKRKLDEMIEKAGRQTYAGGLKIN